MWSRVLPFAELRRAGRWNVARFVEARAPRFAAAVPRVRLGDVTRERRETVDPQASPDREVDYLSLEHVDTLTGDLVGYARSRAGSIRSRSKLFRPGQVLYARLRPYLNKVYLASPEQIAEGLCSAEWIVLAPDRSRVLPRVLRYLLASPPVLEQVVKLQGGAALPRVSAEELLDLQIPLPPLTMQRSLERSLAEADRRRLALRAELDALPTDTMAGFLAALDGDGSADD